MTDNYIKIPFSVLQNPNLCANAKLLFGQIEALTKKTGECWATNDYFAQVFGLKRAKTVGDWVGKLAQEGLISVELEQRKDKSISRIIKMAELSGRKNAHPPTEKTPMGGRKNAIPPGGKTPYPLAEKRPYNKEIEYINENKIESVAEKQKQVFALSILFSFFQDVSKSYYQCGLAQNKPATDKAAFVLLANIALERAGGVRAELKTFERCEVPETQFNAVRGEIERLKNASNIFEAEKASFGQRYTPKNLTTIIENGMYNPVLSGAGAGGADKKAQAKIDLAALGFTLEEVAAICSEQTRAKGDLINIAQRLFKANEGFPVKKYFMLVRVLRPEVN